MYMLYTHLIPAVWIPFLYLFTLSVFAVAALTLNIYLFTLLL